MLHCGTIIMETRAEDDVQTLPEGYTCIQEGNFVKVKELDNKTTFLTFLEELESISCIKWRVCRTYPHAGQEKSRYEFKKLYRCQHNVPKKSKGMRASKNTDCLAKLMVNIHKKKYQSETDFWPCTLQFIKKHNHILCAPPSQSNRSRSKDIEKVQQQLREYKNILYASDVKKENRNTSEDELVIALEECDSPAKFEDAISKAEKWIAKISQVFEQHAHKDPENMSIALEKFGRNCQRSSTNNLFSVLHSAFSGPETSAPSRTMHGSKLSVQPTNIASVKSTFTGKRKIYLVKPADTIKELLDHDYRSLIHPPKKVKRPNGLSKCDNTNIVYLSGCTSQK